MSHNAGWSLDPNYIEWAPTRKFGGKGWIAHKSQPSAPPPPDYKGAAEATAAGNATALAQQTAANRPNQVTPWGTSTWSKTPTFDQAGYDAALAAYNSSNTQGTWIPGTSGGHQGNWRDGITTEGTEGRWEGGTSNGQNAPDRAAFTTDNWTQTMTLSPAEQAALDSQQAIRQNQSNLAQTMQGQVASTMADGFKAPTIAEHMGGVANVNTNFGNFDSSGLGKASTNFGAFNPQGVNKVSQSFGGGPSQILNLETSANKINQDAAGAMKNVSQVDMNAPQFTDDMSRQMSQAAYASQMDLMQPQMQQDTTNLDSQLRLQGLTPGTEAYNTAAQNLGRTQAATRTQAANQAVLTGNQMANTNYASALAGYGAKNSAQGQQYNQTANTFNMGNTAIGQQYAQDATAMSLSNQARNNESQNQLNAFNATNAAQNQAFNQQLAGYGANQQAMLNSNAAQAQNYGQALAGYGANSAAQQNSNAAQSQQYGQAANNYQTAYSSALQNYLQPLNSMNAVLSGQQVQAPNMPTFATAGNSGGADYSGAAAATGSWNQGLYNAQSAAASGANGSLISGGSMMAAAFI